MLYRALRNLSYFAQLAFVVFGVRLWAGEGYGAMFRIYLRSKGMDASIDVAMASDVLEIITTLESSGVHNAKIVSHDLGTLSLVELQELVSREPVKDFNGSSLSELETEELADPPANTWWS